MKKIFTYIVIAIGVVIIIFLIEYLILLFTRPVCPYPICIIDPLVYQPLVNQDYAKTNPKVLSSAFQWFLLIVNFLISILVIYKTRNNPKIKTLLTALSTLVMISIVLFYILVLRNLS
jgi:hypothetical protein